MNTVIQSEEKKSSKGFGTHTRVEGLFLNNFHVIYCESYSLELNWNSVMIPDDWS